MNLIVVSLLAQAIMFSKNTYNKFADMRQQRLYLSRVCDKCANKYSFFGIFQIYDNI